MLLLGVTAVPAAVAARARDGGEAPGALVAALVVAVVAVVVAVGALVALAVVRRRLRRTEEELEEARARLLPLSDRPQNAAEWALRTVRDTAARVRQRGLVTGLLVTPVEEVQRWFDEEREQIRRIAGPDGTLAILFSDIEGSTASNERLGDSAWVRLLREHDDVVRSAVARHGGYVVKSQGDGFMVVFPEAADALAAASRVHRRLPRGGRRLRRTPVRVRIGVHAGTVVARRGDFYGRNVAVAARVAALAEGGETLLTDEVRAALGDPPRVAGADVALVEVGEAELKGVTGAVRLWRLPDEPDEPDEPDPPDEPDDTSAG